MTPGTIEELSNWFPLKTEVLTIPQNEALIASIPNGNLGPAVPTTDPVAAAGPGGLSAGRTFSFSQPGTYSHFFDNTGNPIVIADPGAGNVIMNGVLYYNGTYWVEKHDPKPLPTTDLTNYYNKTDANSTFVAGALNTENLNTVNLYNAANNIADKYISPQTQPTVPYPSTVGDVLNSPGSIISALIAVSPGQYVMRGMLIPTANSHFIRFQAGTGDNTGKTGYFEVTPMMQGQDVVFTVPAGTDHIQFPVKRGSSGTLSTIILQPGTAIVLPDGTGGRVASITQGGNALKIKAGILDTNTRIIGTPTDPAAPVSIAMMNAKGYATAEFDVSPNMFDPNTMIVPDSYLGAPGNILAQAGSKRSTLIPCTAGSNYVISNYFNTQAVALRFETSTGSLAGALTIPIQANTYQFTAPANSVGFIMCVYKAGAVWDYSKIQPEPGTVPTVTRAYGDKKLKSISGIDLPSSGSSVSAINRLTFQNSDKIALPGCSYDGGHGTSLQMKHWMALVSLYTNYTLINFGVSGQRTTDISDRIRRNTTNRFTTRGKGARDLAPKYILVQNIGNETTNFQGFNTLLFEEEWKEMVFAIQSIGAFAIFCTNWMIRNPTTGFMMKRMADRHGSHFHDIGTTGDKMLPKDTPPIRWNGSHPDTRGQILAFIEWLYYLERLPKPQKSIKVFRPRTAFVAATIQSYNYDSMGQRAVIFTEIGLGQDSLSDANISLVDRLHNLTPNSLAQSTLRIDEYIELFTGNPVSFTNVAMVDLTLDKINNTEIDIYVKMASNAAAKFYLKNNLNASTYAPTSLIGVFVICQVSKTVYDAAGVNNGDTYTTPHVTDGTNPLALTAKGKYFSQGTGYIIGLAASVAPTVKTTGAAGTLTRSSGAGSTSIAYLQVDDNLSNHSFEFISTAGKAEGSLDDLTTSAVYNSTTGYYKLVLNTVALPGYVKYDNLKLLINIPATTFTISDIYVEYIGGTDKIPEKTWYEPKRNLPEKIADNTFDSSSFDAGKWTADQGIAVASASAAYRDYPTIIYGAQSTASQNHVGLGFGVDNIPLVMKRTIAFTAKTGYRRAAIRVICRLFPKLQRPDIGETAETTASQLLTKDSYDFGYLCLGFKGQNTGDSQPTPVTITVLKHIVGIGWAEVYFPIDIPPYQSGFELQLYRDMADVTGLAGYINHTFELQLWSVSCQIEGE